MEPLALLIRNYLKFILLCVIQNILFLTLTAVLCVIEDWIAAGCLPSMEFLNIVKLPESSFISCSCIDLG